ncbi:MAG TPA: VacB/RNase II family 3'-5' exoribonuclease [Spirochaetota bacterium]|nr:VacB/RNase II family 3'-5' exoribonuclease [Spirochaetota bacterium]
MNLSNEDILFFLKKKNITSFNLNGLYKYFGIKTKNERKLLKKSIKELIKNENIKKENGIFFLLDKKEIKSVKNRIIGYKSPIKDFYIVCKTFKIKPSFPDEVLKEAEVIAFIPENEIKNRKDYRNHIVFTIDGEDAKDLDDAVGIYEDTDYTTLFVHIADVSFYVKEGSLLDKEAYKRGTSIYLADRVVPMLPKIISNGICSLNPNEDRLSMSVEITFDKNFNITNYKIEPGIIKSCRRFTYEEVEEIINNKKKDDLYNILKSMEKLARGLREKRFKEGSIDFDIPETKIVCDNKSRPIKIKIQERLFSHYIIEEFMLSANRVIAEIMQKNNTGLFRVHEDPDEDKLNHFKKIANSLGFDTKGLKKPKHFQEFIEKIKNTNYNYILNTLLLRSMKQAYYHHENLGHFGLAFDIYTHFTSPIRRYPDLVVHRIIKDIISFESSKVRKNTLMLSKIGEYTSKMERIAAEAERAIVKRKAIHFLKDKLNKSFTGIVSGFIEKGIFVSLDDMGIEGMIPRTLLPSFKYEKNIGFKDGNKSLTLGTRVKVKLISLNLNKETIDFTLEQIY